MAAAHGGAGAGPAGRPQNAGGPSRALCTARASGCKSGVWGRGGGARRDLLLLRRDHHDHLPALEARPGLDHDVLAQIGLDPGGHLAAELLVAHLAAPEADVDLDLVPFLEELAHLAQLDLVVALVGHRTELDFLDLDLLRLLLGFVGALLLFEAELAEVHDLADRRIGVGLDLDQVQALFLGHGKGFVARKHADHLAVRSDHAHARYADFQVPAVLLVRGTDIAISVGGTPGGPGSRAPRRLPRGRRRLHDTQGPRSACRRAAKSASGMEPRSSPARVRTATAPCSFSRSPTTSRYGTRASVRSRIL